MLVGGTQTNQIVIASLLKSFEGVVAAKTGHISTHEAGAIELTGHKVLTLPHSEGKISAHDLSDYLEDFYADATAEAKEEQLAKVLALAQYGGVTQKEEAYTLEVFVDKYFKKGEE